MLAAGAEGVEQAVDTAQLLQPLRRLGIHQRVQRVGVQLVRVGRGCTTGTGGGDLEESEIRERFREGGVFEILVGGDMLRSGPQCKTRVRRENAIKSKPEIQRKG